MKQVLQSVKTGQVEIAEVPDPIVGQGQVLVRTTFSVVSAGTERMLSEFARAGLINKALQQPEKVRLVLEKVRTNGLAATVEAVRAKLGEPTPMGYCNVGTVAAVGAGVTGIAVGDRVASNGRHAELVCVPKNLCALVPDGVSDEQAAFSVLGAIALQGVRLVGPTLGERVVVTGLGLIGLLTVQILRANGCAVLGIDLDRMRLDIARQFGAEVVDLSAGVDPVEAAAEFSRGRGVDAVIVTASTSSNEPILQAARMCRKRGRIVLVGVAGMELSRHEFYEKELSFQVSCSYGPGRYDPSYENRGQDYPIGFVRWTEQRNFEAVLDLMASGSLDVGPLVTHRFPIESAESAYEVLGGQKSSLGIVLTYGKGVRALEETQPKAVTTIALPSARRFHNAIRVAVVGAGSYSTRVLIPAFKAAGVDLTTLVTRGGHGGLTSARRWGFGQVTTDLKEAMNSEDIDLVVIATRHDSHAALVLDAIRCGKHVFVEKPLCLKTSDVDEITAELTGRPQQQLMVGFNRRFAPHVVRMSEILKSERSPKHFVMTVNAGALPTDHWALDRDIGGGRILGEGCHFVDLLRFLAGSSIVSHIAYPLARNESESGPLQSASIILGFADGSQGTIHYLANGHPDVPKEKLEIFCGGKVLLLGNFVTLEGWGWSGFRRMRLWRQNKGAVECVQAFVNAVQGRTGPAIARTEIMEVSRVAIDLQRMCD